MGDTWGNPNCTKAWKTGLQLGLKSIISRTKFPWTYSKQHHTLTVHLHQLFLSWAHFLRTFASYFGTQSSASITFFSFLQAGGDCVSKKNNDLSRAKGDRSEILTSRISTSPGTSPSHNISAHQVHSNDDTASVSNTLPEICCPQKHNTVISDEKKPLRLFSCFKWVENINLLCTAINRRLKEKLMLTLYLWRKIPLHKENGYRYFLDTVCLLFNQCKTSWHFWQKNTLSTVKGHILHL